MKPYEYGPNGYPVNLEGSGISVTTSPFGGYFPYDYGSTGRTIYVDGLGRLVVSLDEGFVSSSGFKENYNNLLNGIITEFTLTHKPLIQTLLIHRNGVTCIEGLENDYVVTSSGTFKTNFLPRTGGSLMATYFYKE